MEEMKPLYEWEGEGFSYNPLDSLYLTESNYLELKSLQVKVDEASNNFTKLGEILEKISSEYKESIRLKEKEDQKNKFENKIKSQRSLIIKSLMNYNSEVSHKSLEIDHKVPFLLEEDWEKEFLELIKSTGWKVFRRGGVDVINYETEIIKPDLLSILTNKKMEYYTMDFTFIRE